MHEIIVQRAAKGVRVPNSALLRRFIKAALDQLQREPVEVTLRIVGIDEMTQLNAHYRKKNQATNVLSFPAELPTTANLPVNILGDIVVCADVVNREAREQHKALDAHWAHMVIHGVCHLAGFDHEKEAEAQVMEQLEIDIMHSLGFGNPYNE